MIIEPLFKDNRNKFLNGNKDFICAVTEKICKKKPDPEKDEIFKIAENAFNDTCDTYEESEGNFFCYAEASMKNAVINYCRKSRGKYNFFFDTEDNEGSSLQEKYRSDQFQAYAENSRRAEEIKIFRKELSIFDYSVESITDSCPQDADTRNILLNTAMLCSADETIISGMYEKRHLPVKEMIEMTDVNKKLTEKYEGYLILLIILFSSDEYLYIKSYLNIKVEEKDGQERISSEG